MSVADLSLLRALDRGQKPEQPDGFDWRAADAEFRRLAAALGAELGGRLEDIEGAESIQDAMFHGQAVLPPSAARPGETDPVILAASNFGRLIAIRPEAAVRPAALASIQAVLAAHRYVYVDATLQDAVYDGPTQLDTSTPTWWKRYFEYSALAS